MSAAPHPGPSLTALTEEIAEGHPEPYATLRRDLLTVLDAALGAIQPGPLLREAVRDGVLEVDGERYELGAGEGLHVLAAGDGAPGFARAARKLFPEAEGLVVAQHEGEAGDWAWHVGQHPVPDEASVEAGEAALDFARSVGEDERLLGLFTGGASALMEVPAVPLEDLQMTTRTLLNRGLSVHEINMLRKHLSEIKGGRLARACPGEVLTLAISDVPHDRPSDIGSGPTVPDPTTFSQTEALVERLGEDNLPPVVVDHVRAGARGEVEETPKPEDPDMTGACHLLATNRDALEAGEEMARELGYRATVLPSPVEGRTRVAGESFAKRLARGGRSLLAGGEPIIRLRPEHEGGHGKGGRNQEVALACAPHLEGSEAVVAAFGSDGIDGPTDAAGAVADGRTVQRAREKGLDAAEHLERNDSYPYFDALDDLLVTGPTGTNAMDVFVGLTAED